MRLTWPAGLRWPEALGGRRPSAFDELSRPALARWPSVVAWVAARALLACSAALALAAAVTLTDGARELLPLALIAATTWAAGSLLRARADLPGTLRTASVHASVVAAWAVMVVVGTFTYRVTGTFDSVADAAFESVAGFTTTAMTVLRPIEGTPDGVLFWRASTQWLGGFAAMLVVIAVLPLLGVGGVEVTESELSGAGRSLSRARLAVVVRRLGSAYVLLSAVGIGLFLVAGMGPFDAVTYAMTTISTGGFSNHDGSFAFFGSSTVEWFAIGGMTLAGANLAMVVAALRGRPGPLLGSTEVRAYAGLVVVASIVIGLRIAPPGGPTADSLRDGVFAVTSAISTTGHYNADWATWDHGSQILLIMLIGVGAMSGSTGGGFRVTRALAVLGTVRREVVRQLHPRSIVAVKVGRVPLHETLVSQLIGYQVAYLVLAAAGAVALALTGLELTTAVSGGISALATTGPAFGDLGPFTTMADQTTATRAVAAALMLAGRLEIAPVIVGTVALVTAPARARSRRRRVAR